MTEQNSDMDEKSLKTWYTKLLYTVVREIAKTGALTGVAAEAKPVWISPYKMLIAKVWEASQKSNFVWAITGEGVITDHIAGNLATTPREAARHFSLKWQMDADRLLEVARSKRAGTNTEASMEAYTTKLIGYAESLYDLATRDEVWQQRPPGK